MMRRAWADFCVLDEAGGLESHAFIYLTSKTAVSPYPCLENNGALCSQGNKGAALTQWHHITQSQGWSSGSQGFSSGRASNNCWGDVCKAQTWGRHRTETAHVLWAPPKAKGWQTQTCSCLAALQGCSPWVCIHQGAPTVCPNPTLSHKIPSFPHWLCVSFTEHTDAWAYCCWAQPGAPLLLRVCDIQIINSFGHTLYFCCSVWSIPTLVQA